MKKESRRDFIRKSAMMAAGISMLPPTEELKIVTSNDFKVIGGHPHFDVKYQKFNALETTKEYINHTYREGWKLPDMPV